jgi:MoaA/NifB/PqqE/SkfB family radical SAM enzyme
MPQMSLPHKIKLVSNYVYDGRWREIYNMIFWVYPLWWNRKWSAFIMNKFLPKFGIDLFPPFLEIEPTTACQYKCACCEHTYWDEPAKTMKFDTFKKIFDGFGPNPKWLGLTGIGTSYLNKDYHKMLSYAKSKGTIIETFDHFNDLKDDDHIRELINTGMDFLFISIYGGNKESYNKVMEGGDFKKAIHNIRRFVALKKEMKKRFPLLSFHYIITRDSKDSLLPFLDFVHSLDTEIAEVLVTPMTHAFKEAQEFAVKIDQEYVDKLRARAKELGIEITINFNAKQDSEELKKRPPIHNCKELIMPFIFSNGDITPCCSLNEANRRDWQHGTSLGNAAGEKTIRELWYSPRYVQMRKMIRANKVPPECIYCPAYDLSDITKEAVEESNRMARENRPEMAAKPMVTPIVVERAK